MDFNLLDKLNPQQKEAASQIDGPILILAGAGSGKTRTITYRIAHMIKNLGINPYSILAVTFTNKAAKEMKDRVKQLVGEDADKATISTFHSFGTRLLRMYGDKIGYTSNFTIYDTDDQKRVLKNILKDNSLKNDEINEREVLSLISKIKEENLKLDESYVKNKIVLELYNEYNKILKNNNAMDFSDILLNTYKLLLIPEILERTQTRYTYVMIDEYQDTNNLQYQIINLIAKQNSNLCVVGDENQSIYGFRGANIQNILDFEKSYKNCKIVKLEENYRSTSNILNAANEVIKNNKSSKGKKLWTQKGSGDLIKVLSSDNARAEANKITELIYENKNKGYSYKDITILYRTNFQSRVFEETLIRNNIPHKIFGGISFYSRTEIKDIAAYISLIVNPKDNLNILRVLNVPKRKIGDRSIEKIVNFSKESNLTLLESLNYLDAITGLSSYSKVKLEEMYALINELREESQYETTSYIVKKLISKLEYEEHLKENYDNFETRIENLEEFITSIIELENLVGHLSISEYLENISLVTSTDDIQNDADYVKLMTIHSSKGLEFPIVFIVGFEDQLFPGMKSYIDEKELEEERRLCYVALTRAEEKLYLSYATSRFMYGEEKIMSKSKFIDEIPKDFLEEETKYTFASPKVNTRQNLVDTKKSNFIDISKSKFSKNVPPLNLKIGDRIKHKKFGIGLVKDITDKKLILQFIDGNKEIANIIADKFISKLD